MSSAPDATGGTRGQLAAVIGCIATYGVTMGLSYPLLSLILHDRGVSEWIIGLNAAMTAISTLAFAPFIPRLMARFGMARFLYVCLALDLTLLLSLRVLDDLAWWFVIRFFIGAPATGLFVASETWINVIAEERIRGRVVAIYNAVLSASFAVGPLVITFTGIEGWTPFLVGAAFISLAAVPLSIAAGRAPTIEGESSFGTVSFLWAAPTIAGAVLLVAILYAAIASMVPVYGAQAGFSSESAAVLISATLVGGLVLQFPIGWLADRFDRYLVLIGCGIVSTICPLSLPWLLAGGPALYVALFLWGGAFAGLYTAAMAIAGERYRGAELATAMAAFAVLWGVGSLLGPTVTGAAMAQTFPWGLPAVLGVFGAAFSILAIARWTTVYRHAR